MKFPPPPPADLSVGGGSQAADPRPLAISSPFLPVVGAALITAADMWKFDAASVTSSSSVLLQAGLKGSAPAHEEKEDEDGLLDEVWSVTTLQDTVASEDLAQEKSTQCTEERVFQVDDAPQDYPPPLPLEEDCDALLEPAGWCNFGRDLSDEERHDEDAAAKGDLEFELDELWNPYVPDGADDQADVCEWIPPAYEDEAWTEMVADSWPPPNIPVEYLDDEFFDEIYGSLDSARVCGDASGAAGGGGGVAAKGHRRHCRRRRRNIQKQPPVQRRRPCSFFVEGECRRPDCKFSHDLASIPCRFWLESSCFKGTLITFKDGFICFKHGLVRFKGSWLCFKDGLNKCRMMKMSLIVSQETSARFCTRSSRNLTATTINTTRVRMPSFPRRVARPKTRSRALADPPWPATTSSTWIWMRISPRSHKPPILNRGCRQPPDRFR